MDDNRCLNQPQMSKNTGVEKINNKYVYIRILTTRCYYEGVNFGIPTTVYIFQSVLFHSTDSVNTNKYVCLNYQTLILKVVIPN
jgi:hypothetical protein